MDVVDHAHVRLVEILDHLAVDRRGVVVDTEYGPVRVKVGTLEGGEERPSPEFEDCARLAREGKVPLREVYDAAVRAWATAR